MRMGLSATSGFSTVRVLYRVQLPYPLRYMLWQLHPNAGALTAASRYRVL